MPIDHRGDAGGPGSASPRGLGASGRREQARSAATSVPARLAADSAGEALVLLLELPLVERARVAVEVVDVGLRLVQAASAIRARVALEVSLAEGTEAAQEALGVGPRRLRTILPSGMDVEPRDARKRAVWLYRRGWSIDRAAAEVGCGSRTVRAAIVKAGVQLRDDRSGRSAAL